MSVRVDGFDPLGILARRHPRGGAGHTGRRVYRVRRQVHLTAMNMLGSHIENAGTKVTSSSANTSAP